MRLRTGCYWQHWALETLLWQGLNWAIYTSAKELWKNVHGKYGMVTWYGLDSEILPPSPNRQLPSLLSPWISSHTARRTYWFIMLGQLFHNLASINTIMHWWMKNWKWNHVNSKEGKTIHLGVPSIKKMTYSQFSDLLWSSTASIGLEITPWFVCKAEPAVNPYLLKINVKIIY